MHTELIVMLLSMGMAVTGLLGVATGGCLPRDSTPEYDGTFDGRRLVNPRPVDPMATVTFVEYERPFLEWDEWTRPLRKVKR